MRATKGAAATVRGRLAALAPMEVPITARVKGVRNSIRIIKGMLRKMFTSQPKAALNWGVSMKPPGLVTVSSTPSGRPMT